MKHEFGKMLCLAVGTALVLTGCHRKKATANTTAPPVVPTKRTARTGATNAAPLSSEQLALKPNEAGLVPVLMYHNIAVKPKSDQVNSWFRSPDGFRKELQKMYDAGFRPVNLSEYIDNKIDLPIGKSPVVLTFDDASPSQFTYLQDGSIDPDCAVGIMSQFAHDHPDWPMKAIFYIEANQNFGQPELAAKKMQALLAMGCELGNHTVTHPYLSRLSDEKVQKEIAQCQKDIQTLAPNARVESIALPFGLSPKNKPLAAKGESEGVRYNNKSVLLVGSNPAPSVIAKRFNFLRIPRIQAADGNFASSYWLDILKRPGSGRYVSDGDANVTTIPKNLERKIDTAHLNGSALRTY